MTNSLVSDLRVGCAYTVCADQWGFDGGRFTPPGRDARRTRYGFYPPHPLSRSLAIGCAATDMLEYFALGLHVNEEAEVG